MSDDGLRHSDDPVCTTAAESSLNAAEQARMIMGICPGCFYGNMIATMLHRVIVHEHMDEMMLTEFRKILDDMFDDVDGLKQTHTLAKVSTKRPN